MRLTRPFLQLPKLFDAERLAEEVRALPASAWVPHPGQYAGNDAVLLVTPGGEATNAFAGPMAPTEHLQTCPYIMEVMADIGAVWGRSRLMGLAPGAEVPEHIDINYYWRTHLRFHIPIITSPEVLFTCGDETVHMKPGECWTFDSFRIHKVHNGGVAKRVHLVLDTVGGGRLWELLEAAEAPEKQPLEKHVPSGQAVSALTYEKENVPAIMSPWEVRCHIAYVLEHALPNPLLGNIERCLEKFTQDWAAAWARFGEADEGIATYRQLIGGVQQQLAKLGAERVMLSNRLPIHGVLYALIFKMAVPQQQQRAA